MRDIILPLLISSGSIALLSAAFYWLLKTWLGKWISIEFEKKLSDHKSQLDIYKEQKTVELNKAASKEIALLKSELEIASTEHQIRFTKLHEKIAETVSEVYVKLQLLQNAVDSYINNDIPLYDTPINAREEIVSEAIISFREYYKSRKLFIPKATAQKIDMFINELHNISLHFKQNLDSTAQINIKERKKNEEELKELRKEIPLFFNLLESDFRNLLGAK